MSDKLCHCNTPPTRSPTEPPAVFDDDLEYATPPVTPGVRGRMESSSGGSSSMEPMPMESLDDLDDIDKAESCSGKSNGLSLFVLT